jgi:hypothetical protein|tara:strand:- start:67 stop:237 length:171 start_codon:yes stop_codon:yes gene_type:complete
MGTGGLFYAALKKFQLVFFLLKNFFKNVMKYALTEAMEEIRGMCVKWYYLLNIPIT